MFSKCDIHDILFNRGFWKQVSYKINFLPNFSRVRKWKSQILLWQQSFCIVKNYPSDIFSSLSRLTNTFVDPFLFPLYWIVWRYIKVRIDKLIQYLRCTYFPMTHSKWGAFIGSVWKGFMNVNAVYQTVHVSPFYHIRAGMFHTMKFCCTNRVIHSLHDTPTSF